VKARHLLIVVAGVVLAALGVGAFVVCLKVVQFMSSMSSLNACAEALKTHASPPECVGLTPVDLQAARSLTPCLHARDAALAAGTDPEKACEAALAAASASGGAAP
jgi:hypothetical protein